MMQMRSVSVQSLPCHCLQLPCHCFQQRQLHGLAMLRQLVKRRWQPLHALAMLALAPLPGEQGQCYGRPLLRHVSLVICVQAIAHPLSKQPDNLMECRLR